jgi:hypothetical protein
LAKTPPAPDGWTTLRPILGTTFIRSIDDNDPTSHPLRIGSQSWSRHALATELGIVHTAAARHLSAFCQELKVRHVKDLWERTTMYQLAREPACGVTTLYVAWRVFEYVGLDPTAWYQKGRDESIRTFLTMKARVRRKEGKAKPVKTRPKKQ